MLSVSSLIASCKLSHQKVNLILFHYFDPLHYFDTFGGVLRSLSAGEGLFSIWVIEKTTLIEGWSIVMKIVYVLKWLFLFFGFYAPFVFIYERVDVVLADFKFLSIFPNIFFQEVIKP